MASPGLRLHQPDEERLPLACLPGATAFQPPMDCDEVAPSKREFPRGPLPRLLPLPVLSP